VKLPQNLLYHAAILIESREHPAGNRGRLMEDISDKNT
jgi:hypothetical protein